MASEFYNAQNSPNALLREVAARHWGAPASHKYDQDVRRLRKMFSASGMSFKQTKKGGRGSGKMEIKAKPPKRGLHVVLYIMGDASRKYKWGGGVMVLNEQGTCFLKAQIVSEVWGLSTKLIEATMVVAALVAIDEWVRNRDVVVEVWAWSDNLSAIRQLVEEPLGEVGVDIMDRLVAAVGSLCFVPNWGWLPAQHDARAEDWLALANKEMDSSAKRSAGGEGESWKTPDVWLESWSVFVLKGGQLVLNPKKYIMEEQAEQFRVVLTGKSYTTQIPQRQWIEHVQELKGGVKGWVKIQPQNTTDWGCSRAWSKYAQVGEWEVTKVDLECPECGVWCPALREHRMHQCGEVRRRVLHWQMKVAEDVHAEGVAWRKIAITWGGVGIKSKARAFNIVWCRPSKCAQVVDSGSGEVDVWPVWLGLGPVAGTVLAMKKQGIQSPARLVYKVLTDLATVTQIQKRHELCYTEVSEMQMGFPTELVPGGNTRVLFGRKEGEKRDDSWVLAPLIWVCASLIGDLEVSPVATVLVKNGHTHLPHWNKIIPWFQTNGWGGGRVHGV